MRIPLKIKKYKLLHSEFIEITRETKGNSKQTVRIYEDEYSKLKEVLNSKTTPSLIDE